jgi:stage II sporulation protein D
MFRNLILTVTLFLCGVTKAQTIDISILNTTEINSVTVSIREGRYLLKKGSETLGEYKRNAIFHISRFGNTIQVRDKKNYIGNFQEIELVSTDAEGILSVRPVNPAKDGINYEDNLIFSLKDNRMRLINRIDMEKYIAAVIEAEGGNGAPLEYYKAQAVLIRTFTIKNLLKHAEEGFNLCDQVHCQAYKARSSQNPLILEATRATKGMVLVDSAADLIMAPFHSNCGGETSSSGMYWQKDLPYLMSVNDPFCTGASNATWSVSVEKDLWMAFIDKIKNNTLDYKRHDFSFSLPHRTRFVSLNGIDINLRDVREHFGLRSSFFSIADDGKTITFHGKGYGHGIGMCQQGAMEMAKVGYTAPDILHFYFLNVSVTDYREMELHRFKPE